jgi:hypothetical protein
MTILGYTRIVYVYLLGKVNMNKLFLISALAAVALVGCDDKAEQGKEEAAKTAEAPKADAKPAEAPKVEEKKEEAKPAEAPKAEEAKPAEEAKA